MRLQKLAAGVVVLLAAATSGQAVSVRRFGVKGNDKADDTAALQRAIDSTRTGTLTFPAGIYRIGKTLTLKSNVTYEGQVGATLVMKDGVFIMALPADLAIDITIRGFTFDGGGVTTQGGVVKDIVIRGNTFQNITTRSQNWTLRNAIFSFTLVQSSSIDHNTFKNILPNGSTRPGGKDGGIDEFNIGIFIYGLDRTSIDHNTFDHVGQAIKVCFSQPFTTSQVYIGHNVMTHLHRMGIEIQGAVGCNVKNVNLVGDTTVDLVIEYNDMTAWDDFYWNSTGISEAVFKPDSANRVVIRNNFINGGVASYNGPYGYGIESGALGLQVYGNVIAGSYGQSIGIFAGSTNASVHDNYTCALMKGAALVVGPEVGPSSGAQYYNNTVLPSCPATLPRPEIANPGVDKR
jgi:hypothetical protein